MNTKNCITGNRLALFVAIALVALFALATFAQADNAPGAGGAAAKTVWLDSLDVTKMYQDWGAPNARKSCDDHPLTLKGVVYEHGVGTHVNSRLIVDLKGCATRFTATVGIDDETQNRGMVIFRVFLDGKKVADTGRIDGGNEPKQISVDLTGGQQLVLVVADTGIGIDFGHADWANAAFEIAPDAKSLPVAVAAPCDPPIPFASAVSSKPSINGPRIVGSTPGRPLLFLIPATGKGPLTFSAKNLPTGLSLDTKTGIISGSLTAAGRTVVQLSVSGPNGRAKRNLVIVGGDHKLALTPPMGWNSWNVWGVAVDDAKVRAAADWMVKSGLAAHGYQYINIDDSWEATGYQTARAKRDAAGNIQSNEKFPDMRALADYVHSKGLKLGIYSSPGPRTCGGFEASYQHEDQDAATYAKWGIDYLKYDWCSYSDIAKTLEGSELEKCEKPYRVMRESLDKINRDIVYSFCQYGMREVWRWGAELGGNCWRTGGDIGDSWGSMANIAFGMGGKEDYAGPGHWNDPDMLVVGKLGWGHVRPTHLTPNEQIFHITAWSLLSSPLLIGCDMSQFDQFTVDILSNDEVLDVNQDPLGKVAKVVAKEGRVQVWARPLWDGTMAVGLLNGMDQKTTITAKWSDLGITGNQPVRDLWQKKNIGEFDKSFTMELPKHAAMLFKVGKPKEEVRS